MTKNIDPIVFPGSYTKSHLHIFFGSDGITANTNSSASLRSGCTSLDNPNDLSTYCTCPVFSKPPTCQGRTTINWRHQSREACLDSNTQQKKPNAISVGTPTLLYTGGPSPSPINPSFAAYYENIEDAEIPIPENYRALAGNPDATDQSTTPSNAGISWFCENDPPENKDAAAFPSTTCTTHLQELVYFPDCVNPDTLNYTYSGTQNWTPDFQPGNRCPADMKRFPRLRFSIRYDLRSIIPNGWNGAPPLMLSSGNSYSAHGDVFNGWEPKSLQNMMQATGTDFMGITGPKGNPYGGANCTATDRQPNLGTSNYEQSVRLQNLTSSGMRMTRRML